MRKIGIVIIGMIFIFMLASCTTSETRKIDESNDPTNIQSELLYLSLDELKEYDGKDGQKAYIAVDGDIYDVSNQWVSGEHNGYMAGTDVSNVISNAPHGASVLESLQKVGELRTE